MAAILVGLFIRFLMFLGSPDPQTRQTAKTLTKPAPKKKSHTPKVKVPGPQPEKPRFEFYTILPEQEIEIPETEIKIRKREEKQGEAKPGSYVLQVGSFRKYTEADRLKAELAMQGIHSNIETAKIDNTTWNRVKIGPYSSLTAVDVVRKRLKLHHLDAIVITAKK